MSSFTGKLYYVEHKGLYCLTNSIRFYIDDHMDGEYVDIPRGSLTNFASIPSWLSGLWASDSDDLRAPSALHDAMVGEFHYPSSIMIDDNCVRTPSWLESARWYRKALHVRGCPLIKRELFYLGVLAYGAYKYLRRCYVDMRGGF